MPMLSEDVVPFIPDSAVSMVVVKTSRRTPAARSEPMMEEGTVSYQVLDVLHSTRLKKGDAVEVPFTRDADESARDKRGFNHWNNLSLEPGEIVILACKPLEPPKLWEGLAAQVVGSEKSSEVAQVRRCYEIEAVKKPPEVHREKLQQALVEGEDIDRRYAVEALSERGALSRDEGVELLDRAIASGKTSGDDKLELARSLTDDRFFNERKGADAANQKVIATLSRGLAAETDADRQREWTDLLAASVLSDFSENEVKNQAVRASLIRGASPEVSRRVLGILTAQSQQGTAGEREVAIDLLAAWRAAAGKP